MRKTNYIFIVLALVITPLFSNAQSNEFKLGQNLEIQYSVINELANTYVDTVDFGKLIPKGIDAMLQSLDPYTIYVAEDQSEDFEMMTTNAYGGVGAIIKKLPGAPVRITEPYENSPATKAGLVPGDEIHAINGEPVYELTSDAASGMMKGQPGTDVTFTVVKGRTKDTVDVVVTRERIHISDIEYCDMIKDSIGYIKLTGFTVNIANEMRQKVQELKTNGAKRLILDLRGNGGGIMEEAIELLSIFFPKGTMVVSSKGRDPRMNQEYFTTSTPVDTLIPVMLMVNSGSASASEIVSGAFQDLDRGVIAGKKTFGKGLIQSIKTLPFNSQMKLTTGKYYTPSGRCVQAIDYSNRNEDGSVGTVPDSLKNAFKTKNGRTVYDGGGITPDFDIDEPLYSRPTVSMFYSDIFGEYSVEYFKKHETIAPPADFHLSDADYEDFIEFAKTQEFDARSSAETVLERLKDAALEDGLYDSFKEEYETLAEKVIMDKEEILRAKKSEIVPLIEIEIVSKFYFPQAGNVISLRNDPQLDKAIEMWVNQK